MADSMSPVRIDVLILFLATIVDSHCWGCKLASLENLAAAFGYPSIVR